MNHDGGAGLLASRSGSATRGLPIDIILRGVAIYIFLVLIFRISGKRALSEVTAFDMILLVIIAEATQQGLLGNDFSVTTACLLIMTLIGLNVLVQVIKLWSPKAERLLDGLPVVLVEDGQLHEDRMRAARVLEMDILTSARQQEGVEQIGQLKYAVLERDGSISVVPKDETQPVLERIEQRLARLEARLGTQPDHQAVA